MIKNLEQLIKEYKKLKNPLLLEAILKELNPLIIKKSKYIYFKKWYPLNYFNKCKACRNCTDINKDNCNDCKKCTCVKGYFNLKKNNLCELDDVKNDLILKVLELIEQFDITKNFYTFFGSVLFSWRPSFITSDFIKNIYHSPLYKEIDNDEVEINVSTNSIEELETKLQLDHIYSLCKTESEKKIYQLYLANSKITEEEIGKIMNMTKQNISLILKKLRKRLKKHLTKP